MRGAADDVASNMLLKKHRKIMWTSAGAALQGARREKGQEGKEGR